MIAEWRWSAGWFVVALLAIGFPSAGCRSRPRVTQTVNLAWTVSPSAPAVGPASLSVTLRDLAGAPVRNALVRVEGHMSHPGMTPFFAGATERAPGVYDLSFAFTMAGDWALLVTVTLTDGTRIERRIDVLNVRAVDSPQNTP